MARLVGQRVSHYAILEHLGEGGMGVVYKARDLNLDRFVALKFLPPSLTDDPSARERFIREAKAVSALQHNNICAIHEIDQTDDGQMFLCLDFYEGENLKKKIQRKPLDLPLAVDIASQLAQGLAEAHRHGIVHRDVKPANIFVTDHGTVKILDFGLAKLAESTGVSRSGSTAGTPAYMSPEQSRGDEVDQRTDVWSFGVVLYEMLVGRRPFNGEHVLAVMYSINHEEPPAPSSIRHDVPEELSALCMQCLKKDPGGRPSDFLDLPPLSGLSLIPRDRLRRILSRSPRALRWALLIAPLLLLAMFLRPLLERQSLSLERTDAIVVADFENRTQLAVLDYALTQGLKVALRQSEQINLLSPVRIAEARELLRVPHGRSLDEQTALAIARREGARAVISPNISKLGSAYVLACGVIDASTGETVQILHEQVDRIEAVLSGLDRLSRGLRENLGESLAHISKAGLPLDQVTTPSLEALDLYSRSQLFTSEGQYKEAALLLEEAVALDSLFVMAISDLAYDYRKIGMDSLATVYHNRVLPLIHRATERERLEILAVYYGPSFAMEFPKAFDYLQQLTVKFPSDAYALATLGHLAMFAGDTRVALEANTRAVALNPPYDKVCYNNSGFALALDGQPDTALVWFRRAQELRPEYRAIDNYIALTYWMRGEYDSARAVLARVMPLEDPFCRNKVRVILACLDYFSGRLQSARALCAEGIRECATIERPADQAYFHYLLSEVGAAEGDHRAWRTHLRRATELSVAPYFELALAGWSYARRGSFGDAEEIVRKIAAVRSYDPYFTRYRPNILALLQGELALARGQLALARQHFDAVERVRAGDPFYLLARKGAADCAAQLSDTGAAGLYQALLSRKGEVVMANLSSIRQTGLWTRWLWPGTHLDLARYLASRGNHLQAGAHLQAALACWSDAEAGDQRVGEARALLRTISTDP